MVHRIESIEDRLSHVETYQLDDGQRIRVSKDMVDDLGIAEILRQEGIEVDSRPVPVFQSGRKIGTVPGTFDPGRIRSTSFLYEPRPGDFIRRSDHWEADRMLGPGDLDCVPGFVWARENTDE